MPKILHDPNARGELTRRVNALTPQSQRRWGRMSVDQMLWHVNGMLRIAIGELAFVPQETLLRRTVIRFAAFNLPWPKGRAPTAQEVTASGSYDFAQEQMLLCELLERFAARDLHTSWPRHPAFGGMSGENWSSLQHKHVDYHLQQFGV